MLLVVYVNNTQGIKKKHRKTHGQTDIRNKTNILEFRRPFFKGIKVYNSNNNDSFYFRHILKHAVQKVISVSLLEFYLKVLWLFFFLM